MRLTAGLDSGPCASPRASRSPERHLRLARAAPARRSAAELLVRALERGAAVRRAGRGRRHLRREDRPRRPPARPAPARGRAGARRARAAPPHRRARASSPTAALLGVHRAALLDGEARAASGEASGDGRGAPAQARPGAGVQAVAGRLLLGCDPGMLELLEVQPPGGRRDGRRRLPARSRRAGAAVGASRRTAAAMPAAQPRVGRAARRCACASGITPAQPAARSPPRRPPAGRVRTFAEASSIGSARTAVAFSSFSVGGRTSRPAAGHDVLDDRLQRRELLGGVLDAARAAEQHRRAVVGGVVHRRAREHQRRRAARPSGRPARPRRARAVVRLAAEPWQ